MSTDNQSLSSTRTWTILSLLEWSADHLSFRGFEDARLNAELLLAHVLGLSRLQLYTQHDRPVVQTELDAYRNLLRRRLNHEPIQYVLGETEFMGHSLLVTPDVLIPRPETEQLVERTLDAIRLMDLPEPRILDIGTGSGNIAIAIGLRVSRAVITSIDASPAALKIAAQNIERHRLNSITLLQADVFENPLPGQRFDAIVSNPPYISLAEFDSLQPEVRDFEPRVATTDGEDGFRFIRLISELSAEKLNAGGYLLMEIAYNQSYEAKAIVSTVGLIDVQVFNDLSGIPRIVQGRK